MRITALAADYGSSWRQHVRNTLREAIRRAVTGAGQAGSGASLKFARSKFNVGVNRRSGSTLDLTNVDGTAQANANGYDQTLDVVEIMSDSGARKGVLFFEVQYWESSRWPARRITIASETNNDKVWRKFTFPPLTTMRIPSSSPTRVIITPSTGTARNGRSCREEA